MIFSLLPALLSLYLAHAGTFNNRQISVTQTSFSVLLFMPGALRRKSPPPAKQITGGKHRLCTRCLFGDCLLLLLSKAGKEGCSRKALPWGSRRTGRAQRGCTGAGHCMGNRFAEGRLFTEAIFHLGH